jgi:hypothetical protein
VWGLALASGLWAGDAAAEDVDLTPVAPGVYAAFSGSGAFNDSNAVVIVNDDDVVVVDAQAMSLGCAG